MAGTRSASRPAWARADPRRPRPRPRRPARACLDRCDGRRARPLAAADPRHVPDPGLRRRDGRHDAPGGAPRAAGRVPLRYRHAARRRLVRCGAGRGRRRAGRHGAASWRAFRSPMASAARPATMPRARCSAATACSTMPPSWPSGSSPLAPPGSRSSTSTTTTGTARSRSSGSGPTCCTSASTPIPATRIRTSRGPPTRAAPGAGGLHPQPATPARDRRRRLRYRPHRCLRHGRRLRPGRAAGPSLGFDTYADDPIGGFALRTDDYATLGTLVRGLGRETVVLQEGGYAVEAIGANAVAFLDALAGREVRRRPRPPAPRRAPRRGRPSSSARGRAGRPRTCSPATARGTGVRSGGMWSR